MGETRFNEPASMTDRRFRLLERRVARVEHDLRRLWQVLLALAVALGAVWSRRVE